MREFDRYHPICNAVYFLLALVFGCLFFHPTALILLFAASLAHYGVINGFARGCKRLLLTLPAFLLAAAVNPLFSHGGVTILFYLPSGNPMTKESIYYGLCFSGMLMGVLNVFSCFRAVMTSDKMLYLTGRAFPTLSLVFSMSLRFVPELIEQTKETADAQKCIGRFSDKGLFSKIRSAFAVLSAVTTRCLENSADIADSMKARGYGLPGRSSFSIFTFHKRDGFALLFLLITGGVTALGAFCGVFSATFYPSFKTAPFSAMTVLCYTAYVLFLFFPVLSELLGVIRWRCMKSGI